MALEKIRMQVLNEAGEVIKEVDVLTSANCVYFEDGQTFQQKLNDGSLKGAKGDSGVNGKSAYQLYVDNLKDGELQLNESQWLASLKGIKGDTGLKGDKGLDGEKGIKGDKGDPFTIKKTYSSITNMNNDFGNNSVPEGSFVMIDTGNVEDVDNAKLYVKGSSSFTFITDLSGAKGIKGEKGDKGDTGNAGMPGIKGDKGDKGIKGDKGDPGDEILIGSTPQTATKAKLFFKII